MDKWYFQRNKKLRKTRYEINEPTVPKKNLKLELGAAALNDIVLKEQQGYIIMLEEYQATATTMKEEWEERVEIIYMTQVEWGQLILQHVSMMRSIAKLEQNLQQTKLLQEVNLKHSNDILAAEHTAIESQRQLLGMVEASGRTEREQQLKSLLQWKNEHESSLRKEFEALATNTRDQDQRHITSLQKRNSELEIDIDSLKRQLRALQSEKQVLELSNEANDNTYKLQKQAQMSRVSSLQSQLEQQQQQHLAEVTDLTSQRDLITSKLATQTEEMTCLKLRLSEAESCVTELNQKLADIREAKSSMISTAINTMKNEPLLESTFTFSLKHSPPAPPKKEIRAPVVSLCNQSAQTTFKPKLQESVEMVLSPTHRQLESMKVVKSAPNPQKKKEPVTGNKPSNPISNSPSLEVMRNSVEEVPKPQPTTVTKKRTDTILSSIRRRFSSDKSKQAESKSPAPIASQPSSTRQPTPAEESSPCDSRSLQPDSPVGCLGRFRKKVSNKKSKKKIKHVEHVENVKNDTTKSVPKTSNTQSDDFSPIYGSSIVNRAYDRTDSLSSTTLEAISEGQVSDVAEAATPSSELAGSVTREVEPISVRALTSDSSSLSTGSSFTDTEPDRILKNITIPSSPPPQPPQTDVPPPATTDVVPSKHHFDDSD